MIFLNRHLRAHHHFTIPYCPQSNETVEAVCKEVLRACRALLSEFGISEKEWPAILPLHQSIFNHHVRPTQVIRAPITAFAGLPADNPLRTRTPTNTVQPASLAFVQAQCLVPIKTFFRALGEIHRDIARRKDKKRDEAGGDTMNSHTSDQLTSV